MASLRKKLKVLFCDVTRANMQKIRVKYDLYIRRRINLSSLVEPSIMVTLTSYGCRLRHSVEYTLYSMLKQHLRPGRIVVWVYEGEYTSGMLPKSKSLLEKYGIEFRRYPKDIRSYKKLIPALEKYPDYHHVIVDDDIYYDPTLVQELYIQHQAHPHNIIAGAADIPLFDKDGCTMRPYREWHQYTSVDTGFQYDAMNLMPIGFGGVFYPRGIFDRKVLDSEIFLRLCPLADDIWFYVHSIRLGIEKTKLINPHLRFLPVDLLRQYFSRDRLTAVNRKKDENDRQFAVLFEHYGLRISNAKISAQ